MKTLLLALLLSAPALAQHSHDEPKPKKTVPAVDEQRGAVLAAPKPGETIDHATAHALPVGKGAVDPEQLGAWLVAPTTGDYLIPQLATFEGKRVPALVGQTTSRVTLIAGRAYRVLPWKGPLVWTPPGGKQGKVPPENLIAVKRADVAAPRK